MLTPPVKRQQVMTDPKQSWEKSIQSGEARHLIDHVADSFVARLRRGEHVSVSEYTARYPEMADEIRTVFHSRSEPRFRF